MFDFIEFTLNPSTLAARQLLELKSQTKQSKSRGVKESSDEGHSKLLELAARKQGLSAQDLKRQTASLTGAVFYIVGAPYWLSMDAYRLANMSAAGFSALFRSPKIQTSGFPYLTLAGMLSLLALGKSHAVNLLGAYFKAYGAWLEKSGGNTFPRAGITLEVYENSSSGTQTSTLEVYENSSSGIQMSTLEIDGSDWLSSLSPQEVLEFMEMSGANADWREQSHGYLRAINPKAGNFLFQATRHEALREDSGLEVFVRLTDKREYFNWLLSQRRSKDLAALFVEYLLLVIQGKNTDSWRFHFEDYAGLSPESCFALVRFYAENHSNGRFEDFVRSLVDPFSETSKEVALH